MKRVAGTVIFAWIAAGWVHAQTVVIGAGYAAPGATDAAPGQILTIFARVPGKIPADPVVAKAPFPPVLAGFTVLLRQTFPSDPQSVPRGTSGAEIGRAHGCRPVPFVYL